MIPGLIVYIYILLGLLTLFFDTQKKSKKEYRYVFNTTYVMLSLLAAFSYGVGNDTVGYRFAFSQIPKLDNLSVSFFAYTRHQPLFVILCSLCRTVYDDLLSLQILQIFMLYHSLYLVLKKLNLRKFWVLFLFFGYCYITLLSSRRECFGLAFCLYAILFYINNKLYLYYGLVVLGFLCHSGMFIFAVFPLLKFLNKLNIWTIILVFGIVLSSESLYQYFQIITQFVNDDDSITRYQFENNAQLKFTSVLSVITQLLLIVWFVLRKRTSYYEGFTRDFIFIGIISIMIGFLTASMPILYRYRAHFSIFLYFTLDLCFKNAKKNKFVVAVIFLIFSYSPLATFIGMINTQPLAYNYCSYFSSDFDKARMDHMSYK